MEKQLARRICSLAWYRLEVNALFTEACEQRLLAARLRYHGATRASAPNPATPPPYVRPGIHYMFATSNQYPRILAKM